MSACSLIGDAKNNAAVKVYRVIEFELKASFYFMLAIYFVVWDVE
jgi:hypothetical protein